ncbi:MAG: hypothetical protein V9E96_03940 [Chitinophagaceae bacterium]
MNLGLIATQLLHKIAISASISFEKAMDNGSNNKFPASQANSVQPTIHYLLAN